VSGSIVVSKSVECVAKQLTLGVPECLIINSVGECSSEEWVTLSSGNNDLRYCCYTFTAFSMDIIDYKYYIDYHYHSF